ncbi:hypothetical protein [Actinomadura nitritigenes]|uniref:hypothetical protein n=1 Tax=Actinomadura nitritigenes TaxID=134602 RepID=UPI003D9374E6
MTRLVTQYVTKLGAVAESMEPPAMSVRSAVEAAAKVLEMPPETVIIVDTISGGAVTIRTGQLDHIAVEPYDETAAG